MNVRDVAVFVLVVFVQIKFKEKFFCSADEVPYAYPVSIRVNFKLTCVGALLTKTWVVTLCDCVPKEKPQAVTLRIGMLSEEAQILNAEKIICHPQFVSYEETADKNLALIKTYYAMKTDHSIRLWVYCGKVASVDKCAKLKLKSKTNETLKNMFCAEFFNKLAENCSADRGTLMLQANMLWGLMNYNIPKCGKYRTYVPYVDISEKSNLNFILRTVSKAYSKAVVT